MSIFDLLIIIFILFGGVIGFKQGFTKTLVNTIGYIAIIMISFIFKDALCSFLIVHLPFFDFYGVIKGLSAINIALYEIISFSIIFSILLIILKILLLVTTIFEKILTMTIILGIPSKILGFITGLIKNYIIVFVILYILSVPVFSTNEFISCSKLKNPILKYTPVLSIFTNKSTIIFNDFNKLIEDYKKEKNTNKFNLKAIDLYLKYNIVSVDTIEKLNKQKKLHINNLESVLERYK